MSSDEIKTEIRKLSASAKKSITVKKNEYGSTSRVKTALLELQTACANLVEENKMLKLRVQELENKFSLNEGAKLESEYGTRNLISKKMGALFDGASNKLKINLIKTVKKNYMGLDHKICYAHTDGVSSVDVKNTHVLSGSLDSTIKVWTTDLERCVLIYRGHDHPVNSVRGASVEEFLTCSSAGDGSVHIWSLKGVPDIASETNIVSRSNHESLLEECAKSSDSNIFTEKVLNINKPLIELKFHQEPVSSIDWTYDDKNIISASWDNSIIIWDVEKSKPIIHLNEHEGEVTYVQCHSNQKIFISSSVDSTIRLWDMRSAKTPSVSICHGHNGAVNSAIFCENLIVSGGSDKSCKLWELRSLREPLSSLKTSAPITQISSLNQSNLCIPARNGHFRLWNYHQKVSYSFFHRSDEKNYSIESCCWFEALTVNLLYTCYIDGSIVKWTIPVNISQKH